jgi:multiple sugar transport system substrate-binding protein
MEDSNNWLYMTQTLKEQGFYTHSWGEEPSFYLDYSMGMFDNNMTYLRNTKKVFPIMDLARETFKQELASNSNLFEPSVNHSITLGNTVMVHTGLLFENILKEVGSNSAGNWRITTMPFGMYGLSGHAVAAISSTSKHKSEAWNVIEWMAEIDKNKIQQILNEEASISGEDFYGGQHIAPMLRNLIERSPEYQLTPVDERAKNIWWRVWFEGIQDTNLSTEMLLSNIERAINNELSDEIKITREFLQEIPK